MYIKPLISVIIPCFNGASYISHAVESVRLQTYNNIEIIVIDDNSTDDSRIVLKQFSDDITLVHHCRTKGVAAARNEGIALARGEFIAFLDQDDLWAPTKLAAQLSCFFNIPKPILVHTSFDFIDSTGRLTTSTNWKIPEIHGRCFYQLFMENGIIPSSVMVERSVLLRHGAFREDIAREDDYHMWLRLALEGSFFKLTQNLTMYRLHSSQASQDRVLMAIQRLKAIQDICIAYPAVRSSISWYRRYLRVSGLHRRCVHELWRTSHHLEALSRLILGLLRRPLDPFHLVAISEMLFGKSVAQRARWYLSKLTHLPDLAWT